MLGYSDYNRKIECGTLGFSVYRIVCVRFLQNTHEVF